MLHNHVFSQKLILTDDLCAKSEDVACLFFFLELNCARSALSVLTSLGRWLALTNGATACSITDN